MSRACGCVVALVLLASPAVAADKYSIAVGKSDAPKEVKDSLRSLLSVTSVRLLDEKNETVGEVWFRREVPAKATPEQVKNGLTYREIEEGTFFGVLRFDRQMTDYRKQKVAPGVYTLRMGFQPMDGDHMGTAPHSEFLCLVPAAIDEKPDAMEAKQLREESAKAAKTSHPCTLLLFPNPKPEDAPKLVGKENNHWVLNFKAPVVVDKAKTFLGLGLTLVGHSTLE